ncbi:MAG: hypothetical protein K8U03_14745 [Planctomycetia bacterium]|nr:hypothetical protein [Planctomycetia bacterium]
MLLLTSGLILTERPPVGLAGCAALEVSWAKPHKPELATTERIELVELSRTSAATGGAAFRNPTKQTSRLNVSESVSMDIRAPIATRAAGNGTETGHGEGDGKGGSAVDGDGATFFGVQATGRRIAFVVDTSGSMKQNKRYLRCREELKKSLAGLKPNQQYFVVFFNSQSFPMPGRKLVDADAGNLSVTHDWLRSVAATGRTDPLPALGLSLAQSPDAIFLLTDGKFADARLQRILALHSKSDKIPIHTIAFESREGEGVLSELARATGGTYRFVP